MKALDFYPFSHAVEDVSRGNPKLPQSEFRARGVLPVIDQGQRLIAGYTNDPSLRCRVDGPLIVFGDHTRAFKFVNFPFVVGADGVKVLRVRDEWEPKYVYHYLVSHGVPNAGYSRHFKFLKEIEVPKPSLAEQRRIAAIFDQAEMLRAKRRTTLVHIVALSQSIFNDMFGDLEWSATLGDLADVQIGPFGSLLHQEDYVSGGVPVLNPMHIRGGRLTPDLEFSVSEAQAARLALYKIRTGDVVLGRRGEMGRAGVAGPEHDGMLCGTGSVVLRPKHVDSTFLHSVVTSTRMKAHLERSSQGATLSNLNAGIVKAAPAPRAANRAQAAFADRLGARDRLLARVQKASAGDDSLFTSLQSRAFRGEL